MIRKSQRYSGVSSGFLKFNNSTLKFGSGRRNFYQGDPFFLDICIYIFFFRGLILRRLFLGAIKLRVNCLRVNCLRVNCLRVNCLRVNCLRVNCLRVNCLRAN